MTREHVHDGHETFDRIGRACDELGSAGYPALEAAIAGYARERRGRVQASPWPGAIARSLIHLADELEHVVTRIPSREGA